MSHMKQEEEEAIKMGEQHQAPIIVSKDHLDAKPEAVALTSKEDEAAVKLDFEDLIQRLGEFGSYQKWLYFFLWIPAAAMAVGIYASVYLEFVPSYNCHLEGCETPPSWITRLENPSCTLPASILNGSRLGSDYCVSSPGKNANIY